MNKGGLLIAGIVADRILHVRRRSPEHIAGTGDRSPLRVAVSSSCRNRRLHSLTEFLLPSRRRLSPDSSPLPPPLPEKKRYLRCVTPAPLT
ncbi:hypothetical protein MRB53_002565 [Persea americana]|uniref:Uncharacterized protein n=1 Tax=Persea americana TaxID=3435 RepID=A0ACC2MUP0_PERAE|nr:hypothetical protein MRB53_002565 [Persea americana]